MSAPGEQAAESRPSTDGRERSGEHHPGGPQPVDIWIDVELTDAIREGSREALAEVYRRHGGPVFAAALRVSGDLELAGEVVEDVFVGLWAAPERVNAGSIPLAVSLSALGRSRAVDLVRSGAVARPGHVRVRDERSAGDGEAKVAGGRAAEVRQAVGALPANEREAIALAYFAGHSCRRVARILRVGEDTVNARIRRGLHRLGDSLAGPPTRPP